MTRHAIAAALAAGLLLAGCSSKPAAPDAPDSSAAPAAPAAHGGFADCRKSHGVTEASGPAAVMGPPPGVDQGTWDSAMQACSSLAPGPGPGTP